MPDNPTPWPDIGHFPEQVANAIQAYVDSAQLAAVAIQRAWRHRPLRVRPTIRSLRRGITRYEFIYRLLTKTPHCATMKFDGTNLGKDAANLVYGRRLLVAAGAVEYQKGTLAAVYSADIAGFTVDLQDRIFGEAGATVVVYGELMLPQNEKKYEYAGKGLVGGTWHCFGAVIQPTDSEQQDRLLQRLAESNLAYYKAGVRVVLLMCDGLRGMLQDRGLSVVPELARGSILEIARVAHPWLVALQGEGVVVVNLSGGAEHRGSQSKWKNGSELLPESQQAVIRRTAEAVERFPACAMVPGALDLLRQFLEITAHPGAPTRGPSKTKTAPEKEELPYPLQHLNDVIGSALSKYDSLEVWVAQGNIGEIMRRLTEEVEGDLHPETDAQRKQIDQTVRKQISKAVALAKQQQKKK
eukprot:TRINITY_DN55163_c0_g1_i1.p1 TRINITY_DN55163_c0_g1~~TRINITY_DN55163_c0_g1_i1.p1  ORF type:complete len:412 (+),score=64.50 TRINITY_DN55163_c0_g1_i1:45-1280(+)